MAEDLYDLIERFKDFKPIRAMHSYKLLERVLKEQCNLKESDDQTQVEVKNPKQIASDSLQNPSDPDTTYSGHKGLCYQLQVMETYTDTEDQEAKSKTLNLLTMLKLRKHLTAMRRRWCRQLNLPKNAGLVPKSLRPKRYMVVMKTTKPPSPWG